MPAKKPTDVTQIVNQITSGSRAGAEDLFPILYEEFLKLARRYLKGEAVGHTLQPTALVHEVYLKLVDQSRVQWHGKTHFFAVGAQAMRRILVDHARRKKRNKRGGGRLRIALDEGLAISPQRSEDLLALDEALVKLAEVDARQATIVELRFFAGLSVAEVAEVLGVSKRTVESEWTMVRAWLRRELLSDKGS